MTAGEGFVRMLEGYYGEYAKAFRREVADWVDEIVPKAHHRALYKHVVETISRQFQNQPDIVQLREALPTMPREPKPLLLDAGDVVPRDEAAKRMHGILTRLTKRRRA